MLDYMPIERIMVLRYVNAKWYFYIALCTQRSFISLNVLIFLHKSAKATHTVSGDTSLCM